ncbi:ATP-dependent protease [Halopseudomonas pachastrellae]|uniref:ATP-dependent protease n=1 Tax=Halopseudomonas pachastrellae TaxID=254161 RepID=A0A1S8DII7_9GAMM|nr:YifB family Mg chelatase-like AAA ATPase [Halopseudomonas pachastrellae]ONM44811.1 ATP-dependent protease [Halopseudomonas pachastrellae]SFM40857.1 magnesium chelatase family protein [Halopseudomonas pachastrellae]
MSLAIVHSRARLGIDAPAVSVEVHLANGMPSLTLVGLPETAVRESKDRVRSALQNAQLEFPGSRRITISLAPADLPKEGGRFDLAIALGLLAASGQIPATALQDCECIGELALSGELRPVQGVLPVALACREAGRRLILPRANATEAALVEGVELIAAEHLLALCAHLRGEESLPALPEVTAPPPPAVAELAEVQGQEQAKRALIVAAAGGHNLLLFGPPGTGKTLLASRLPGILPPLREQEALEVAAIQSVCERTPLLAWPGRPFRAPHHGASAAALVGGGSHPRPGEVSQAHNGVLFLDELPEFDRKVLETLREPLESGSIHVARAREQLRFPARFQLVAAMNPCPCGYQGDPSGRCRCSPEQIQRYRGKLSGPLLDRIDLHLAMRNEPFKLTGETGRSKPDTATAAAQVAAARQAQQQRQQCLNAHLDLAGIQQHCALTETDGRWLEQAVERLGLSRRASHRVLKVARTLADLAGSPALERPHLAEALQYRQLDRQPQNGQTPG